ncbi:MAG TPA: glycosyltransferase [Phycisphaerae bacterium]|nr:glycosyltransferase [Phycisphaerae bacterium]
MTRPPRLPVVYAYPGCRWDMPPGRHKALMEALAGHTRIFFLNWPEFRGTYTEVLRPRAEKIADNITVIHNAFGLRFARGGKRLGRAAGALDGTWIKDLLRGHGVTDYVYWIAAVSPALLWGMNTRRFVFDCIDPCFDPAWQARFDREEAFLARKARVVFATAESLWERMKAHNPNSHLLPNGCNESEYHPEKLARLPRPAALQGRTGPVIGYMGTFDWRIDATTLTAAAQKMPDCTFALVGRVNSDQEANVATLRSLPNVVMPGAVSLEDGWAWTAAFDVGLIPFQPGDMGDAINPVKMHMYLMAGKPVVTTWIRECRRHGPLVRATQTPEQFVTAIRESLAECSPADVARRLAFSRAHTWKARAAEAADILDRTGLWDGRRTASSPAVDLRSTAKPV